MTSVAKDRTSFDTNHKIMLSQITGYKYFLLYSFNYVNSIIIISYCILISYGILIHPVICDSMILWLVSDEVRRARLVSYAFLYTTYHLIHTNIFNIIFYILLLPPPMT